MGPSGGGKSSCISLMEHLYDPERGEVLLDGKPVWAYEHHWYHRHVSIVGQVGRAATRTAMMAAREKRGSKSGKDSRG